MTGTQADKSKPLEAFRFPWPFPDKPSLIYKIKSYITIGLVSSISKFLFIGGVNKIIVHNKDRFMTAWEDRSRPLITVANHRSNIDDPLMWTMLSLREMIRNIDRHRYTLAAHNICFSKQWHTNIFSLGRCVPCVRGAGIYQEGMNFCVEKLNQNGWVHIFPEGRVTESPIRFKWGIGRLIMDSKVAPVVLPIWCSDMQRVWPVQPPYYPRFGHNVNIHIGDPVDTIVLRADVLRRENYSEKRKRKVITDIIQEKLYRLGEDVGTIPRGTAQRLLEEHRLKDLC